MKYVIAYLMLNEFCIHRFHLTFKDLRIHFNWQISFSQDFNKNANHLPGWSCMPPSEAQPQALTAIEIVVDILFMRPFDLRSEFPPPDICMCGVDIYFVCTSFFMLPAQQMLSHQHLTSKESFAQCSSSNNIWMWIIFFAVCFLFCAVDVFVRK